MTIPARAAVYANPSLMHLASPGHFSGHRDANFRLLVRAARSGDEDAVELLLNYSSLPGGSEVADAASDALVDLYGDPTLRPDVRQAIASQALRLFEVQKQIIEKMPARALADPFVHLKTPIAYLAGQRAHAQGFEVIERDINDLLRRRCLPQAVREVSHEDGDLLSRGRMVRGEELIAAVGHSDALVVNPVLLELTQENAGGVFAGQVRSLHEQALEDGKPRIAFVCVDHHFVTLVIDPAGGIDRCDALIVDTNRSELQAASSPVLQAVRGALAPIGASQVVIKCAEMQSEVPNACGPLCACLAWALESALERDPASEVDGTAQRWLADWTKFESDQKNAVVTAARARLLATLHDGDPDAGFTLNSDRSTDLGDDGDEVDQNIARIHPMPPPQSPHQLDSSSR